MQFVMLRLGLGAGIFAFVASVSGEFYRDEGIVGQRTVGWVLLLLALLGLVSAFVYVRTLQERSERATGGPLESPRKDDRVHPSRP